MWLIFSLISAVTLTGRNVYSKVGVDTENPLAIAWASSFFSFPVALISILFGGMVITDASFWPLLMVRVVLETLAILALLQAFKFKSVSYVTPLLSLSPLLTAVWSFFLNGERLSPYGLLGMIVIASGCLLVYYAERSVTAVADRAGLAKTTMLVGFTAVVFSILDPLHALIIGKSSTYTYFFASTVLLIMVFTPLAFLRMKSDFIDTFTNLRFLKINVLIGLLVGFDILVLFLAIAGSPAVALVSSIRTTNTALTAGVAFVLFKEKFSRLKLLGIAFAVIGVIVVTLS